MRTFAENVLEGLFVADVFSSADAALSKQQVNQMGALIKAEVLKAQVISAENVAEYMYAVSDKEKWRATDFSCLAPPFPLMFFEFRRPSRVLSGKHVVEARGVTPARWGVLVREVSPEEYIGEAAQRLIAKLDKDFNTPEETPAKQRLNRLMRAIGAGETSVNSLNEADLRMVEAAELYKKCTAANSWKPAEELVRQDNEHARWVLSCLLVIELGSWPEHEQLLRVKLPRSVEDKAMWVPPVSLNIAVDSQGNPLCLSSEGDFIGVVEGAYGFGPGGWPDEVAETARLFAGHFNFLFKPALFAIGLMHCKNAQLRDAEQPAKWRKAYQRRHGKPPLSYKTIHLAQFNQAMDANGRLLGSVANSPYRLHQVRGHYKTYSQDAPLFGKVTGRFFWGEQFRGKQGEGVIKHRYEIGQSPSEQS